MGDRIFRAADWGRIIQWIQEIAPGAQVYEVYDDVATQIWFAYPSSNIERIRQGGLASDNVNWAEQGATIEELDVAVTALEQVNRVVVTGGDASFVVAVASESIGGDTSHVGLIPNWPLLATDKIIKGAVNYGSDIQVQGIGPFDYTTGEYQNVSLFYQPLFAALEDPDVTHEESPTYKQGFNKVGREWRLPNWFINKTLEHDNDIFQDDLKGKTVEYQLFIEKASAQCDSDGKLDGTWSYAWFNMPPSTFHVDPKKQTLLLADVPATRFIRPEDGTLDMTESGKKICRIALVFTYSDPDYALYADTFIDNEGIEPDLQNAIATGTALHIERPDLRYGQVTNINMPIIGEYNEVPPPMTVSDLIKLEACGGMFTQVKAESPFDLTYREFMVAARDEAQEQTIVYTGLDGSDLREPTRALITEPKVIQDDSKTVWRIANDVYNLYARRPRAFHILYPAFDRRFKRGVMVALDNMDEDYFFDGDCIEAITYDFVTARTRIVTTNQPGHEESQATLSRHVHRHRDADEPSAFEQGGG